MLRTHLYPIGLWLTFGVTAYCQERGRKPEEIVADIATHNQQVRSLSWQCECRQGTTENGRFTPSPEFTRAKVILEPSTGRCRLHIESIKNDRTTGNVYFGERRIVAFDGKRALVYLRQGKSASIPDARPGPDIEDSNPALMSAIHAEVPPADYEAQRSGLAFVLGHTHAGDFARLVSQASREKRKVTTEFVPDALIDRIRIAYDKTEQLHEYDRRKQCFSSYELIYLEPKKHTIIKSDIDLTTVAGVWLPRRAVTRHTLDPWTQQIEYSNWKVNEPVDDKVFAFSFPAGSRVEDHIDKKIYVAGKSAANEAKARQDYMLTFGTQEPPKPWYGRLWYMAATIAAIVIVLALMFIRRRRRTLQTLRF